MNHLLQTYFDQFTDVTAVDLVGPEDFPALALDSLKEPLVFVDGGVRKREAILNGLKGFAVGDGDSLRIEAGPAVEAASLKLDLLLPERKDYSDFAFVLKSLPASVRQVRTFGFMGGRLDHQILNFGEAHHFLRLRHATSMTFDFEVCGLSSGTWHPRLDGRFSLINFEACDIRLEGLCEYQLKEAVRIGPVTSVGLSNMGYGQVELECSSPVFLLAERKIFLDE